MPRSLVNIEIKNLPGDADYDDTDRAAELVVELLDERSAQDDVIVSSFNLDDGGSCAQPGRARRRRRSCVMLGIDPLDALDLCADHGHVALHPSRGCSTRTMLRRSSDAPRAGARVERVDSQR